MMAITTRSSISVKPLRVGVDVYLVFIVRTLQCGYMLSPEYRIFPVVSRAIFRVSIGLGETGTGGGEEDARVGQTGDVQGDNLVMADREEDGVAPDGDGALMNGAL